MNGKTAAGRKANSLKLRRLVVLGILFALSVILSIVEDLLHLPVLAPGVKLGLANIVVMYTLFFMGSRSALLISVLKALFVFITRGLIASFLSLSGGLLSIAVMALVLWLLKEKVSYLTVSIAGAVFHNMGQLLVISVLYTNLLLWVYFPILLVSGLLAGVATSTLLKVSLPAFKRAGLQ